MESCQRSVEWAAGVLEGEGSFISRATGAPIVACEMTDLDVLEALRGLFGGTIYETPKAKEYFKDAWRWQVYGDKAASVMLSVRPFMMARRTVAIDAALAVWQADGTV